MSTGSESKSGGSTVMGSTPASRRAEGRAAASSSSTSQLKEIKIPMTYGTNYYTIGQDTKTSIRVRNEKSGKHNIVSIEKEENGSYSSQNSLGRWAYGKGTGETKASVQKSIRRELEYWAKQ